MPFSANTESYPKITERLTATVRVVGEPRKDTGLCGPVCVLRVEMSCVSSSLREPYTEERLAQFLLLRGKLLSTPDLLEVEMLIQTQCLSPLARF